ncbi:MAG TPA: hypothetical protein VGE30_02365 [Candidatus Saccharimonadales bacterium]
MENNPFGHGSYEAPDAGAEKPNKETKKVKKKTDAAEAPAPKVNEDVARSVAKLPLFERDERPAAKAEARPEASEKSLDTLSAEEEQHIKQETAREHLAAIEQADAETAEELQPAAEFLQRVAEGQDVEEAYHEAASEAGLTEEEIAALDNEADNAESVEEPAEAELEAGVIDTSEDSEGSVGWSRSASSSSGSGRGGSGSPPPSSATPTPPTPPTPAWSSAVAFPPAGGAGARAASAAPNVLPARANRHYQERNKTGELLLIGLVGYLIGRRRGRVRAEKRLLPVQKKLEKQVKQLEQDITLKEQKLVAVVAEKRRAEARPTVTPVERTQPSRVETRLNIEKPVRAERLGHMIVAAEAPRRAATSEKSKPAAAVAGVRAERVPDLSRNELLEVSDKIIVEGASLRRIYESRLIGEKQLRHLVREHLQGRDIRKDLRREMVEHEIDFERDPILRDRVRSKLATSEGGALGDMLAKAGITTDNVDPAFEKRVQQEEARQAAQTRKRQRTRAVADSAMVTAIVGLAALVAYLVLGQ